MNEQQAVTRLKQGNIDGLEALVQRYGVKAVRAAALITHDRALAEDIVQAAFIRAYERIHQFDETRPFEPWFLRSVVNDAVKAASRRKYHAPLAHESTSETDPGVTLADPAPGPDALLEHAETKAAIWQALAQLPPDQRAAVVLRYYLDLTENEIAAEQDCPRGTVKWRLHRARRTLRVLLTPWKNLNDPARETSASQPSSVREIL